MVNQYTCACITLNTCIWTRSFENFFWKSLLSSGIQPIIFVTWPCLASLIGLFQQSGNLCPGIFLLDQVQDHIHRQPVIHLLIAWFGSYGLRPPIKVNIYVLELNLISLLKGVIFPHFSHTSLIYLFASQMALLGFLPWFLSFYLLVTSIHAGAREDRHCERESAHGRGNQEDTNV